IENILALYYTKLVKSEMISMSELVKLTAVNTAKSIGLEYGTFEIGSKVNALLFDVNEKTLINNCQSLYNGERVDGKVIMTFQENKISKF
ncbi:MAG: amidohydrolase family protein, partial [Sulfurimonas sp.]|nr:amidohydrolase family protein [Sulfurimonas sp.]